MAYCYGGYPYGYYPYSFPLLYNSYKLAGLYNELDELNDVEAKYSRDFQMPTDVSMNNDLHMQLKYKNNELVQHIVKKDIEIDELKGLLKKNSIPHDNQTDSSNKPRIFYPRYPYPYPYPYPDYPYPDYPNYRYRDGVDEPHSTNTPPTKNMIVPKALEPNSRHLHYIIPPHVHLRATPPPPPFQH